MDAESAEAVHFPDHVEILVSAARRVARGASTDAWFWRSAFSGWQPFLRGAAAWRQLFFFAEECPAPVLAFGRLMAVALKYQVADDWNAGLNSDLCGYLLGKYYTWPVARNPEPGEPTIIRTEHSSAAEALLLRQAVAWGLTDPRTIWSATLSLVAQRPSLSGDVHLPSRAMAWIRRLVRESELPRVAARASSSEQDACPPVGPCSPTHGNLPPRHAAAAPLTGAHAERDGPVERDSDNTRLFESPRTERREAPDSPVLRHASKTERGVSEENEPSEIESGIPTTTNPVPLATFTAAGGLLFLLKILGRLEWGSFVTSTTRAVEQEITAWLLLDIANRCRVPASDPLLVNLRPDSEPPAESNLIETWRQRLRRTCRLELRMGLANLIARPARLEVTRSHIDLYFLLSQGDVRIRRSALDLDPGWNAWLGRVISFHYVEQHPCEFHDG